MQHLLRYSTRLAEGGKKFEKDDIRPFLTKLCDIKRYFMLYKLFYVFFIIQDLFLGDDIAM